MTVSCTGNRNEALNIMVTKKFRHLPVLLELPPQTIREEDAATLMPDSETGSDAMTSSTVVGLLDITKCVFDRLDELQNKATDDERILSAMELLEGRGMESGAQSLMSQVVAQIQGCPSVGSVLSTLYESEQGTNSTPNDSGLAIIGVPEAMMKTSVKEVAQIMKEYHHTAVIILSAGDSGDRVTGILTTKDIVLRVLAANLDPVTTSAVRVMVFFLLVIKATCPDTNEQTPHPDFVTKEDTILNCLQKLKTGRYLHLPVMDGSIPVGLVDVMTLTISMLTYLVNTCL